MPTINLLEKSVYELIAAGEVIERPSSVIKELAENSIDAGARTITVEIKRGGVTYIRVSDDGCGIAYEDMPKAFLRHATSKVLTADDLEDINTLGFRGEALASVCAVGRVECVSKRPEDALGTSYRITGGEPVEYERTGCADGTTVIIRDLFFNTPARLKFLKKDVTEGNYCAAVIEKLALSHPAISFRFIRDGRQTMMTGGDGEYYSAVYAVFGKQFAAGLIPAEGVYRDIGVQGYVSSPLAARKNRSMQHFFVNGRSVKSPLCSAALEEAFRNSLMVGRFPACVLSVNLDPAALDANISPTKTEVRFSNEKAVFDAIYAAVKNALTGFDESREIPLDGGRPQTLPIPSGVAYPTTPSRPQTFTFNSPAPAQQQLLPEAESPLFANSVLPANGASPSEGSRAAGNTAALESTRYTMPAPAAPEEPPLESYPGFAYLTQKSFLKRENEPADSRMEETASLAGAASAENTAADGSGTAAYNPATMGDFRGEAANTSVAMADTPAAAVNNPAAAVNNPAAAVNELPAQEAARAADSSAEIAPEVPPRAEAPLAVGAAQAHVKVRVVGELFKTYIVCESEGSMLLIDKHAAHERINFELFKSRAGSRGQLLLEPCEVRLSPEEYEAASCYSDKLAEIGLTLDFGENCTVRVTAMPQPLDSADPADVLESVARLLARGSDNASGELFDDALHTMACKASVRGNEDNDITELEALADRVLNDRAIRYCPHGRPVLTQISRGQLERYFGRTI